MGRVKLEMVVGRECGECSVCCEGWLSGVIRGREMKKGLPCYYKGEGGCKIYDERPGGCREYECEWKRREEFPEWMKPSVSRVLMTERKKGGMVYYTVQEAGRVIGGEELNWVIQWILGRGMNVQYEVGGKIYMIGSVEFVRMMVG